MDTLSLQVLYFFYFFFKDEVIFLTEQRLHLKQINLWYT